MPLLMLSLRESKAIEAICSSSITLISERFVRLKNWIAFNSFSAGTSLNISKTSDCFSLASASAIPPKASYCSASASATAIPPTTSYCSSVRSFFSISFLIATGNSRIMSELFSKSNSLATARILSSTDKLSSITLISGNCAASAVAFSWNSLILVSTKAIPFKPVSFSCFKTSTSFSTAGSFQSGLPSTRFS